MVRKAQFAGAFYPSEKEELRSTIEQYLDRAKAPKISKSIKAMIVPHAGYMYSGPIAAFAYKLLQNKDYQDIILLGPSHSASVQDLALCTFSEWETPFGKIPVSKKQNRLLTNPLVQQSDIAHIAEHSIEVQLPFLQTVLEEFAIVPIATGFVEDHKEAAEVITTLLNEDVLLIVSTDLCHYLPYNAAQSIDKSTIDSILHRNMDISHDRACGADCIKILMHLATINSWKAQLLDYRNSGDTSGIKDQVVGYASIVFTA